MNEKEIELIYIVIASYDDNPDYDTIRVFKNLDKAYAYFKLRQSETDKIRVSLIPKEVND